MLVEDNASYYMIKFQPGKEVRIIGRVACRFPKRRVATKNMFVTEA